MTPTQIADRLRQVATRLKAAKSPDRALVAAELRRILAAVEGDEAAGGQGPEGGSKASLKEVEDVIYPGRREEFASLGEDEQGSSIWWQVFPELGMLDWTPMTDYSKVEQTARGLLEKWSQGWNKDFTPEQKQSMIEKDLKRLKRNWEEYQQHYMPEHIEKLKSAGIEL